MAWRSSVRRSFGRGAALAWRPPAGGGRAVSLARLAALAGVLLLALGAALLVAAPGRAARPDAANAARLDRTIRFLQDVQNADGGFGGEVGAPSDPLFSAWVAIALAAGGVNPRDQKLPGGDDVYGVRHAPRRRARQDDRLRARRARRRRGRRVAARLRRTATS